MGKGVKPNVLAYPFYRRKWASGQSPSSVPSTQSIFGLANHVGSQAWRLGGPDPDARPSRSCFLRMEKSGAPKREVKYFGQH